MENTILKCIKSNDRLFNRLKKQQKIKLIYSWIFNYCIFIIKRKKSFFPLFIRNSFCYYILGIRKDIVITINDVKITMPNHMRGIDGAIEIFTDEFYDKLSGYNNVLDLGGYIGESAIRLSKNNLNVIVYEAHPENYEYLCINILPYKNIKSYNYAVVGSDIDSITFYGGGFNMGAGVVNDNSKGIEVKTKNIIEILSNNSFDAIKMDIEGAEFDCLDPLIKNPGIFQKIKGGFIEFHFNDEISKKNLSKNIIIKIKEMGYKIEMLNAIDNKIFKNIESLYSMNVILIYFNK